MPAFIGSRRPLLYSPPVVVGGGGGGSILTWLDWDTLINNAASYSFTSKTLGVANANRRIVVVARHATSGPNITACTVAGITATQLQNAGENYLFIADVPTGTSGTIALTLDGTTANMSISWYRLITSNATPTFDDREDITSGGTQDADLSVTVPSGGAFVAHSYVEDTSDRAATWTSATEDLDAFPESATRANFSTASGTASTSTLRCNWSAGSGATCYVVWGP